MGKPLTRAQKLAQGNIRLELTLARTTLEEIEMALNSNTYRRSRMLQQIGDAQRAITRAVHELPNEAEPGTERT